MTELQKHDTLQMFFDENFDPASYVDALYSSIAGSSDRYAPQTLSTMNAKTQDLLTHLDYNTTVLTKELETKMAQLEKSSSAIGVFDYGAVDGLAGSDNSETSRLQYYVDSLKNAVETLSVDVDTIRRSSSTSKNETPKVGLTDPIESLLSLEQVKGSILRVYHVIQNAKKKVGGVSDSAISDEQFSLALSSLYENLKQKLRESTPDERAEIVETVKELRSWVSMFQPFTKFGPAFLKFVIKMEAEL